MSVAVCSKCSKRLLVVPGRGRDEEAHHGSSARCPCGGELEPASLVPGVYEVKIPRARSARRRGPPVAKRSSDAGATEATEADLGYNESHGYGPSHGGPTGPGDAPADPVIEHAEPLPKAESAVR